MKIVLSIVLSLVAAVSLQAQLGGIGKKIPGIGGGGGGGWKGDISKLESESFDKATPAAEKLYEASLLFGEAFNLKLKDNTKKAAEKSKNAVVIAKIAVAQDLAKQLSKVKKDELKMSPEQKEKYAKAYSAYTTGAIEFAAVGASVGLAIKEVVEQDPVLMASHIDLGLLGAACGKDLYTILDLQLTLWSMGKKADVPGLPEGQPTKAK